MASAALARVVGRAFALAFAVSPDPVWEIAVNAYEGRLGMLLPAAHRIAVEVRPGGADHHMDWETLTHAEVGSVGIP